MIPPDIVARRIGAERQPIVIVDGFHPDPDTLRRAATEAVFEPAHRHYPGIRAPLPADYFARVRPMLAPVLAEVFGHKGAIDLIDASFSLVTTPPEKLTVAQRIPHVDAADASRIALVHYLSPDNSDGTAFYRHRATGFETIDVRRSADYLERRNTELRRCGEPPPAYICDSSAQFECIATIEARQNRAVIYRSMLLHSGSVRSLSPACADPLSGRLTVTGFLSAD